MAAIANREAEKLKAQADAAEAIRVQQLRLAEQAAMQTRITVRELFDRWHKLALCDRVDSGNEARRSFEADVFPSIGAMAIEDVRKTHIQGILDTMRERATADKPMVRARKAVLGDLRQMFHWALERDYLDSDPTAIISKGKLGKNVERDRYLSEAELIDLFKKLPHAGLASTSRLALLIQLSTAARIGEILASRWEHLGMV
jgi:integrase